MEREQLPQNRNFIDLAKVVKSLKGWKSDTTKTLTWNVHF